jgi:hypothetical protein
LTSVLWGLVAVLAAFATGWLLTLRVVVAAAIGATVACWPKFLVVNSSVTNSAGVIALCACAVPAFLRWDRSRRLRWAAATGLLLVAAALTEETALPVAGLMLAAMTCYALVQRDWRAPAMVVGCFALVCGGWYVREVVV